MRVLLEGRRDVRGRASPNVVLSRRNPNGIMGVFPCRYVRCYRMRGRAPCGFGLGRMGTVDRQGSPSVLQLRRDAAGGL
jgi:hypothetical protein